MSQPPQSNGLRNVLGTQPGHTVPTNTASDSWGKFGPLPLDVLKICICRRHDVLRKSWHCRSHLDTASKTLYETVSRPLVIPPPPGPLVISEPNGWGPGVPRPTWWWRRDGNCLSRTDEHPPPVQFPWAWKCGIHEMWILSLKRSCVSSRHTEHHRRPGCLYWDDEDYVHYTESDEGPSDDEPMSD